MGEFRRTEDASNQDIVNTLTSEIGGVKAELQEHGVLLERIDREQELILGEEMEGV